MLRKRLGRQAGRGKAGRGSRPAWSRLSFCSSRNSRSCSGCYAFQVAEYAKHFTCLSIDLRGTGDSDKPEGVYSSELFADDVAAFNFFTSEIAKPNPG